MTSKNIKIKEEDKTAASDYLKKAKDNYSAMAVALNSENFNAVGTLAIQCAISSADAICIYEKGIRSISSDYFDVCDLVSSVTLPEAKEKAGILRKIISKKNLIQYERRNIHRSEADELAKLVTRFHRWICDNIIEL